MHEQQIKAKYKKLHDELSAVYYKARGGSADPAHLKAEFESQHARIWVDLAMELANAGYTKPPGVKRDLEAEIDELARAVTILEDEMGLSL